MNLTERLNNCRIQFNDWQIYEVMNCFNNASTRFVDRSKVDLTNTQQIQSALASLKAEYDKGTPVIKAALEQSIAKLEREYHRQSKVPDILAAPLEVVLILNSCEGNKELIIPIEWDARPNAKENKPYTIVEKLYSAAKSIMQQNDLGCDEIEWNGYVRFVSKDVANKADINHLQSSEIEDNINSIMKEDFDKLNIQVHVIQTRINSNNYTGKIPFKLKEPVKIDVAPKETNIPAQASDNIEALIEDYACVAIADAAKYLGINTNCLRRKVQNKDIHGISKGSTTYIPLHDIMTYLAGHKRVDSTVAAQANRFCPTPVSMDDARFKAYQDDVGELCSIAYAAEFLGLNKNSTNSLIDKGQLHGAKYKGQWYIPKKEIEFVKKLRDSQLRFRL